MMWSFFFSSRRRHTRSLCDWSSDVCSSDLEYQREKGGYRGWLYAIAASALKDLWRRTNRIPLPAEDGEAGIRSEERRVGKEGRGRRPTSPRKKKERCGGQRHVSKE